MHSNALILKDKL